jgi:ABC-type transport system involved in multi-copper enzyme maturation permease subunit
MDRVLNAVKLDFMTGRFYLALYPLLFILGLVIGTVVQMPIFTVILVIVLGVFIAGGVFSTSEKNHGERLYGTLPLRRRDMVLGRYLYGLVLGVGATVIAGILGFLASWISGADMSSFGPKRGSLMVGADSLVFWAAIGFAFLYFCFSVGVAFPIYFHFGFSKAYVFTMLPLYLVVLAALLITRNLNPTVSLSDTLQFFMDHVYLLPIIGVVGGLILLGISFTIANPMYSRKEI